MATSTPETQDTSNENPEVESQAAEPDELQTIIEQIKANLQSSLEDSKMDAFIRKQVNKVKDWDTWTQESKLAYANILTAEILYTHSDVLVASKALTLDEGDNRKNFINFIETLKNRVKARKEKVERIAARKIT